MASLFDPLRNRRFPPGGMFFKRVESASDWAEVSFLGWNGSAQSWSVLSPVMKGALQVTECFIRVRKAPDSFHRSFITLMKGSPKLQRLFQRVKKGPDD